MITKMNGIVASLTLLVGISQTANATWQEGTNGGYWWALWWNSSLSGSATISFPSGGGNYKGTWTNVGNSIMGKGWDPGSVRTVGYNCGYMSNGDVFGLYFWAGPQVESDAHECYITEIGTRSGTFKGTVNSDGGTYNVYLSNSNRMFSSDRTVNAPTASNRTITMANHVNFWASKGMYLGSPWDGLRLAAEAWGGKTGSVNASVW